MQFIVPGQGQSVPNGTKGAVPFDSKDPFIFHSLSVPNIEVTVKLLKEDAALAPLSMTHEFDENEEAEPILDSPLIQPWTRAGRQYRSDIEMIDLHAGDIKYVFTTPGYVYRWSRCTLAFRLSNLLARGNIRFRAHDMISEYRILENEFNQAIRMAGNDDDEKEIANEDFFNSLSEVVKMSTLSPDLSRIVTPDFIRTRAFNGSRLSNISTCIIQDAMQDSDYLSKHISDNIQYKWRSLLMHKYVQTADDGAPETLFDATIPLRSAEMIFDPKAGQWIDTNQLIGNQLSGLGRMFVKTNRRRLIAGVKHRR
jgi:hypothetical protein